MKRLLGFLGLYLQLQFTANLQWLWNRNWFNWVPEMKPHPCSNPERKRVCPVPSVPFRLPGAESSQAEWTDLRRETSRLQQKSRQSGEIFCCLTSEDGQEGLEILLDYWWFILFIGHNWNLCFNRFDYWLLFQSFQMWKEDWNVTWLKMKMILEITFISSHYSMNQAFKSSDLLQR